MRNAIMGLAAAGLLIGLGAGTAAAQVYPQWVPPQVIVRVVADDLGAGEVGIGHHPGIPLPHIDALAARGVNFTDANATSPVCLSSRVGMMTGRYQQLAPVDIWTNPVLHGKFPPIAKTVLTQAEALRARGYYTTVYGKYPVQATLDMRPLQNGYEESTTIFNNGVPYANPGMYVGNDPKRTKFFGNITDILTDRILALLDRKAGSRVYVEANYTAPHLPYTGATPSQLARCEHILDDKRRGFCAAMVGLDDAVGRITAKLAQQGILDSSMMIFAGDNGCEVGCTMAPFAGKKGSINEGGTRVPMIISWPRYLPHGAQYPGMTSLMDIYPTMLSAATGTDWTSPQLQGVNLLPHLAGVRAGPPHEWLFFSTRPYLAAAKHGPWKLIAGKGAPQLYNLTMDIGEQRDLAKAYPGIVQLMQGQLGRWRASLAPFRR